MTERGGTLLPLGGTHKGYKGFGLALMVDVLSQGLADFGRADPRPKAKPTSVGGVRHRPWDFETRADDRHAT